VRIRSTNARFALAPLGLGAFVGVGAGVDDPRHPLAEPVADDGDGDVGVLDQIVQHRRDGLVLVAAVVQDHRGDAQEVGVVRHVGALLALRSVGVDGPRERLGEPAQMPTPTFWKNHRLEVSHRPSRIAKSVPPASGSTQPGKRDPPRTTSTLTMTAP
jgi:hypothetical protein